MKLIIGLGNPGKKYERTRHNAGFAVVEKIISDLSSANGTVLSFKQNKKLNAEISEHILNGKKIIFAKPQTFMNDSGVSARAITDFYKIKTIDLIVVHDDKDIPLGEYRIQTNRGPAGHNGVKSIIEHLGTKDFSRVRVGIAAEKTDKKDTADFVLEKFNKEEKNILDKTIKEIATRIIQILK
ncbi:MAG: aminoacyl-tRNA hydrolase [Patescibacteria group bacterium]|nr:aminoacyl-tRNA hydrolase [Patescibacteria group bacterium]